jgi:hypothetical protein
MNLIPPATLLDNEAAALDNSQPGAQNPRLGSRFQAIEQRSLYIQKIVISAAANVTALAFLAEVSGELVDAWAVGTAASGSGTATLRRVTTALTSAIVMAVVDALAHSTSDVQAQKTIVQGETLNIVTNGAADRGIVYLAILRS